ncbi:protein trichome birefringence-like 25 [Dioscorea cayenensis subsp. rotundata]|uniref:Protein trichome birefringence-like 25 n=1 Tax=Dioscorea cayennensis subsp. rotundata TaxID=55577 RepID=A0AB40ATV4_DIOCR|nr:protein trichome birefringence-like 25 [Dioscorea cayenensis subsp. rotundata]
MKVCNLWNGEWIPNAAEPTYTYNTCNLIPPYVNCVKNGRPDTSYLQWRWKPNSCDLPLFAFIGDSICHSLVFSLICQIAKVAKAHDIYHDPSFKTRTWYYPSHNVTLYVIWSPFLIHYETVFNHGDASQIHLHLHLDILDSKWTSEYNNYDYVVISIAPHFFKSSIIYENNQVIGCHHCPRLSLKNFATDELYRKALHFSLNFIAKSKHKTFFILKTWSPNHSEKGELPNEIICNKTRPFREEEIPYNFGTIMRGVEVEEFEKAVAIGEGNMMRMELLDTYHLSLLRPDGHPGPYGTFHPFDGDKKKKVKIDCLHWCLPGPIDTWNELLLKIVINGDANESIVSTSL